MMDRRGFLQHSAATAALACFPASLQGLARSRPEGQIERRALGQTGEMLSMVGLGGVVVMDVSASTASNYVAEAVDYGVNYFDVAPTYGNAEEMLGPALKPYRKNAFLACKTQARDRAGAMAELDSSLKKLETDHFDLYQFHAVTEVEDAEKILGPGGALEAFLQAKRDGKIRFIGFSAHSVEAAMRLLDGFEFDTLLFPFNFRTWHAGNFGPQVLQKARYKKMGILGLKAMAQGPYAEGAERTPKCWYEPLKTEEQARMGLRFALSHPLTAAVPPGNEELFRMALKLALEFEPLSNTEVEEIKRTAAAGRPLFEYPSSQA
jgi:predicted aldo/keto reductase-like oxidoreductase